MNEWVLRKYPRTQHVETSRLGFGDATDVTPFTTLAGMALIVEEKVDGANSAVSVDASGRLRLQSRGHELTGGREGQFDLFKQWAHTRAGMFADVLGDRYIAYGEWCFAKHSMFYDLLPHYWLEFDVLDTSTGRFLDTATRHNMWQGTGVVSVPVLSTGPLARLTDLTGLTGPSLYKSADWESALDEAASLAGVDPAVARAETDMSGLAEGVYVKAEADGQVAGRWKWVRAGFNQTIVESGTHWADRPVIANRLTDPAVLWS